jgi:hypothetical protein
MYAKHYFWLRFVFPAKPHKTPLGIIVNVQSTGISPNGANDQKASD